MHLICKAFTLSELKYYVENLKFNGWTPKFVVVHNTSVPNQVLYKKWHNKPEWTMEQWGRNLASYYTGMGWNGCPHLFVGYDKILVLNDLSYPGTHSPSWNKISWGVETIAEFENELFENGIKDNLIGALAILHARVGLDPVDFKLGVRGLHFHKEDIHTTHKSCPGKNLNKEQLIKGIIEYMNKDDIGHSHVSSLNVHEVDTSLMTDYQLSSVIWLQQNLNAKCNAGLKVDGILGEKTKEAVRNFQKTVGLSPVDGIPGPVTRKALRQYLLGA